jgi:hypothetical protein
MVLGMVRLRVTHSYGVWGPFAQEFLGFCLRLYTDDRHISVFIFGFLGQRFLARFRGLTHLVVAFWQAAPSPLHTPNIPHTSIHPRYK